MQFSNIKQIFNIFFIPSLTFWFLSGLRDSYKLKTKKMSQELINVISVWVQDELIDSTGLKKIKTAIENGELVIYGSIEFVLNNELNRTRTIIKEESRIVLTNLETDRLREKLDELVGNVNILKNMEGLKKMIES